MWICVAIQATDKALVEPIAMRFAMTILAFRDYTM